MSEPTNETTKDDAAKRGTMRDFAFGVDMGDFAEFPYVRAIGESPNDSPRIAIRRSDVSSVDEVVRDGGCAITANGERYDLFESYESVRDWWLNPVSDDQRKGGIRRSHQVDFAMSTVVRDNEVRVVEYVGDGVWVERE